MSAEVDYSLALIASRQSRAYRAAAEEAEAEARHCVHVSIDLAMVGKHSEARSEMKRASSLRGRARLYRELAGKLEEAT